MNKTTLGIIGGSGVYNVDGLKNSKWVDVNTPFGSPSDSLLTGTLHDLEVVFLPRHGRGHVFSPTEVPYQANIYALKSIGVTDILAVSACGSLQEDMKPGDFVIVDQFVDRTFSRPKSFFGKGCVAHVSMAKPTCERLSELASVAMENIGIKFHQSATYLAMEGPQFSTLAESLLYRESWNCDVIGMTNMPEAKLAREAELCYLPVAMVTDYDCWHEDHENVEVSDIIKTLGENSQKAKSLVIEFASLFGPVKENCLCGCDVALEHAIITDPQKIPDETKKRLECITNRVLATR